MSAKAGDGGGGRERGGESLRESSVPSPAVLNEGQAPLATSPAQVEGHHRHAHTRTHSLTVSVHRRPAVSRVCPRARTSYTSLCKGAAGEGQGECPGDLPVSEDSWINTAIRAGLPPTATHSAQLLPTGDEGNGRAPDSSGSPPAPRQTKDGVRRKSAGRPSTPGPC